MRTILWVAPRRELAGPSASAQLDSLASELAERAVALAAAAHGLAVDAQVADERTRLPIADRLQARDRFIYELLLTDGINNSDLLRRAEIMGMDLTRPRAVILLQHDQPCARSEAEALIHRIVHFFHLPNDTICGYLGAAEVVVLKAASSNDLEPWAKYSDGASTSASWANLSALKRAAAQLARRLQADDGARVAVGVGRHHPGLPGLGQSYRDARVALSVGRQYQPGGTVYALDTLGLGAWLGGLDEATRIDLASRLVGPLEQHADLLETLDAFFAENGSPSATVARLAIHRNTLTYRLDRVARLTGLDPRRFDDAVQLRLALLLGFRHRANAQFATVELARLLGT